MEFKIFRWACTCISDFIISFDAMFHNRKYRQTPDLWLLFTPINNFFYPSLCSLSGNNFWMAVSLPYLKIERDSFQDEFYYTWNFLRIQWNFHKDPLKNFIHKRPDIKYSKYTLISGLWNYLLLQHHIIHFFKIVQSIRLYRTFCHQIKFISRVQASHFWISAQLFLKYTGKSLDRKSVV